jgi:rhodanese-related sulfurtransferase
MTTDLSLHLHGRAATEIGSAIAEISGVEIRSRLIARQEVALLDVSSEAVHALSHPLFAANLPLSRIEVDALDRIPRLDTLIAVFDRGEGDAQRAVVKLRALGYLDVRLLQDGLDGWQQSGGELFSDVNAPSKAFGELVEHVRHTPSLSAEQVQALIDQQADIVIVDVRRYDEYHTMNIPGSQSLPGGEAALRISELLQRPTTQVIVNCAGRTRSIIGTQSLINAGIQNPVAALRNGTIGWTLAGQRLEQGQTRRAPLAGAETVREQARVSAEVRALAERAGVRWLSQAGVDAFKHDPQRTTYYFDVRDPDEYAAGHAGGFISAAGGQLVQETDFFAPVRGARIVLLDTDGVRANITGSWLAQMGWEVHVWERVDASYLTVKGRTAPTLAAALVTQASRLVHTLSVSQLRAEQDRIPTVILDLESSARYRKQHIPGAVFIQRQSLTQQDVSADLPDAARYVLTSADGLLAFFAAAETPYFNGKPVYALIGGNEAWQEHGHTLVSAAPRFIDPPNDVYRRPYEGTDNPVAAMQAYLDWEYGLVAQLAIDGTHGFKVL